MEEELADLDQFLSAGIGGHHVEANEAVPG